MKTGVVYIHVWNKLLVVVLGVCQEYVTKQGEPLFSVLVLDSGETFIERGTKLSLNTAQPFERFAFQENSVE